MRILIFLAASFIANSILAQSFFTPISDATISLRSDQERTIIPNKYQVLELHIDDLKTYLLESPHELDEDRTNRELALKIPMPDGSMKTFMIYESPTMMEKISARYPNIKSYKGYARANNYENLRISINPKGFYAAIRTVNGTVYIDPYSTNNSDQYISYYVKDHETQLEPHQLACGTQQDPEELISELKDFDFHGGNEITAKVRGANIPLRQYRLAISCTGEFGQIRNGLDDVLADINTSVTRLNQIFENDLSIRMILVDRNDEIIYEDPDTDPYFIPDGVGTGYWLLERNTTVINNKIGASSYDLGHIYHRSCTDVGGVAFLGSICSSNKGAGVTCHSSNNLEYVTVSIAAHEMGHQLGSPHSFNNCGGNESIGDGYEPGSGTTIMSYAGLCGSNNVQGGNDDYYHVGSLMNIYVTTRELNGASCAEVIDIDNHTPDIQLDYTNGFYIPISTPFILTGDATDEDGNNMTYSWEQTNSGPISPLGAPVGNAPSFRVYYPDENKTRILPRSNYILSNTNFKSEVLPTYNRDFEFHFVARDNNPQGGTASWDYVSFKASTAGGPFLVTSNNSSETLEVGSEVDITWDVANTDQAPINCERVNIYMSYEGELNTDVANDDVVLLATNVANDGLETVVIPTRETTQARIIVRAADNIFFDVSNQNNTIELPTEPAVYFESDEYALALCSDDYTINLTTLGLGGYDGDIRWEVEGLPTEAAANFDSETVLAGNNSVLNLDFSSVIETGSYELKIRAIADGIDTLTRVVSVENTAIDFSDFAYIGPENGIKGYTTLPTLEWMPAQNAVAYTVEIASNPSFSAESIIYSEIVSQSNYTPNQKLDVSSVYYWRVRPENNCKIGDFIEVFAFSTESLSCDVYSANNLPINISQSGTPSIKAEIVVPEGGQVADVNVSNFRGLHERNKDLSAYLISPDGTSVKLFGNECGNQSNFNCAFDDESPVAFNCPLNSGETFIPEQSLSILDGKDIGGLWILQLDDNVTGNSGKLQNVSIELCSNLSLDPPVLVNLNVLELPPGKRDLVSPNQLLTTDANNSNDELVYTLVKAPTHGLLQLNLVTLAVGDQWTQADINTDALTYLHSDDGSDTDDFRFDVVDGDGGWIEITQFDVAIDDSFTSGTIDSEFEESITLYPNPANESVIIRHSDLQELSIRILDLSGRLMSRHSTSVSNKINTATLGNGVYIVEIKSEDKIAIKKMVIQR